MPKAVVPIPPRHSRHYQQLMLLKQHMFESVCPVNVTHILPVAQALEVPDAARMGREARPRERRRRRPAR